MVSVVFPNATTGKPLPIAHPPLPIPHPPSLQAAFSLLEVMVALALLGLAASVLMHAQMVAVSAGRRAELFDRARLRADGVLLAARSNEMPEDGAQADDPLWRLSVVPVPADGRGVPGGRVCRVALVERPSLGVSFRVHPVHVFPREEGGASRTE